MSGVRNITVPWVPLDEFDWSFKRTGPLPWNLTVWALLAVFTALPIWTTVELTVWVFYTFKRYQGVYFYSVLFTTWGVTLHAIGFILKYCVPKANWILATVLAEIGWVGMVSGFSVVLWSRLHLVSVGHRTLKIVLAMIIIDACLFHIPTIVFQFLVSNKPTHTQFLPYMKPMERVQVMGFSTQEIVISAIYVYATMKLLQDSLNPKMKKTMAVLILIQVIVILADVLVITLDYLDYFQLKAVMHSFVYAFKLQLEFVILNEFRERIAKNGLTGCAVLSPSPPNFRDLEASSNTCSPANSATKLGSAPAVKTRWFATRSPKLDSPATDQHTIHTENATIYASTITIQQTPPTEARSFSNPSAPSHQNQSP
ncbi:hypothetical protein EJ05DRAFT_483901 [Pseudovirgaria hyperparasitica]|uniref:DUF7703 domain-containing protein n=1 Tax=Pseudovirgaria hyperparasitica TaxID=470096 RepID=A0A6A6WB99_9PEZI|nr:uncharacterized protein EJ05DRAFT_483901 [Pseudovirgaria hyperparasitica]KAF2760118.1 hypothetical protein EJ05DRAFT_483901 [Pseudovirgaria hyperparasitica]